jgi:hypothetical protein
VKKFFCLIAIALCLPLAACKTAQTTQPLAPGYTSQADETIGRSLAAARGYYVQIQSDIQSGKYKPGATELAAYNSFGLTLNTAEVAYLAFHNGTGTLLAAQSAANQVATQQAALQAAAGVKQP